MRRESSERGHGAGSSLIEVMVSVTILALALSVALVLYDGARRSFKIGDNLSEQQQVVRIAFDRVSEDLRMAGFNTNPDGDKNRPDEQIEAALDRAVVIRADFDGKDAALSAVPEAALAGGSFFSVSTGNDEIVAYVLGKADDSSSGSLTFDADVVGVPRDGVVEPVTIDRVDIAQGDPPYALYRITVNADGVTTRRSPLADNIRSLRFVYYDVAGNVITPAPGGLDDPLGDDVRARAAIRRIGIAIEGLTRDGDPRWTDRDDPDPDTRQNRKYELSGDVTPRNLGIAGLKDLDAMLTPPTQPPPPMLYPGHCGGLYVRWSSNPAEEEVARYEIRYGTDPAALGGLQYSAGAETYLAGLSDGVEYHVTIEAVDDSGNVSPPSVASFALTENQNQPLQPGNLTTTTDDPQVAVDWDPVTDNVPPAPPPPSIDPLSPEMRDFAGYRLYRSVVPGFTPPDGNLLVQQPGTTFDDNRTVHCKPYWYQVVAVDQCGLESGPAEEVPVPGSSSTTESPHTPLNVQAYEQGSDVRLVWDPVTRNDVGPIVIDRYRVCRKAAAGPAPDAAEFTDCELVIGGVTELVENPAVFPPFRMYYIVQATDWCPNVSPFSDPPVEATCVFAGEVVFSEPANNAAVAIDSAVTVDVPGGGGGYVQPLNVMFTNVDTGVAFPSSSSTGPPWTLGWPPTATSGLYRIDAEVRTATCDRTTSIFAELQ